MNKRIASGAAVMIAPKRGRKRLDLRCICDICHLCVRIQRLLCGTDTLLQCTLLNEVCLGFPVCFIFLKIDLETGEALLLLQRCPLQSGNDGEAERYQPERSDTDRCHPAGKCHQQNPDCADECRQPFPVQNAG